MENYTTIDTEFDNWKSSLSNENIYVQIASYRDPELIPTIKDCLEKAKFPSRLRFGICWQHSEEDEWDDLSKYSNDSRFRIIDVPWNESKGLCWARAEIQKRWEGEAYTMQLDSHHRFAENWDVELIEMLHSLDSYKPIITGYCGRYDPQTEKKIDGMFNPLKIVPVEFRPEGTIIFSSQFIENPDKLEGPVPARFMSGHFFFTYGIHARQFRYDPFMYFLGDEITLSVKSYTLGYDLFHPHKHLVWHEYLRESKTKHWTDFNSENKNIGKIKEEWTELATESFRRIRHLLQEEYHADIDLGEYGLGNIRSLSEYELYAGINFSHKKIHEKSKKGILPPINDHTQWYTREPKHYKIELPIPPTENFSFIYVGIESQNGNIIFRKDLTEYEPVVHADFVSDLEPYKWVLWPVSKDGKWENRKDTMLSNPEKFIVSTDSTEKAVKKKVTTPKANSQGEKILVLIASYRDPRLLYTIRSALSNAARPDNLTFAICWQRDEQESLEEFECHPQVRILSYHYSDSKGLGWARHKLESLYDGEDFILQLDSHHIFGNSWDTMLLEDYENAKSMSSNPLITTYLTGVDFEEMEKDPTIKLHDTPCIMTCGEFLDNGLLPHRVEWLPNHKLLDKPVRRRTLSAHFLFGPAKFLKDVPNDPSIYFGGESEETTLSVRAWTRGYDFFAPHRCYLWHDYSRKGRPKHWEDHSDIVKSQKDPNFENTLKRVKNIFRQEDSDGPPIEPIYAIGNQRTMEQYVKFSGIDFEKRVVEPRANYKDPKYVIEPQNLT